MVLPTLLYFFFIIYTPYTYIQVMVISQFWYFQSVSKGIPNYAKVSYITPVIQNNHICI